MDGFERCVLVFARLPEKGCVKTRLEKRLSQDIVLKLYKAFVEDILAILEKGRFKHTVCYWPPDSESDMKNWLGSSRDYMPQSGDDLGQRMRNAFQKVFAESTQQALLIGTDIPDLDPGIIEQAFHVLSKNDMTIGPAEDGGYYLIGFNSHTFCKDVFNGVSWGSGQVFKETMQKARQLSLRVHTLPKWLDIDTPEDLELFYRRGKENGRSDLKSMAYLDKLMA